MSEQAKLVQDDTAEVEQAELAQARAEIAAGQGVPHERVREWLMRLAAGEQVPPPTV